MRVKSSKPTAERRPANGKWFVGLLVGGPADVYRRMRPDVLEEFGIDLQTHWSWDRRDAALKNGIPSKVEVILVLTDMIGGGASKYMTERAKKEGVAIALVGRKRAAYLNGLRLAGFPSHPAWFEATASSKPGPLVPSSPPAPRPEAFDPLPVEPASDDGPADVADEMVCGKCGELVRVEFPDDWTDGDFCQRCEAEAEAAPAQATFDFPRPKLALAPPPPAGDTLPARESVKVGVWTEADTATLVRLAEATDCDPATFCERMAAATGQWRSPGAIQIRLRALTGLIKVVPGLLPALGEQSHRMTDERRARLRAEAIALKAGFDNLPESVSEETALRLVGGVKNRLARLARTQDRTTGLAMYRRDEVLRLQRELNERLAASPSAQGGALDSVPRMPPRRSTWKTPEQIDERILDVLADGPKAYSDIVRLAKSDRHRTVARLEILLREGRVVEVPTGHPKQRRMQLPGYIAPAAPLPVADQEMPGSRAFWDAVAPTPPVEQPPPEQPPVWEHRVVDLVATPRGEGAVPVEVTMPEAELRREVFAAIKRGEITPTQGAEMLQALAKVAR